MVLLLPLFSGNCAISQGIPRLEEVGVYEASLKEYHNRKFTADRHELLETRRKKWWYYLPTAGWQLGRPAIQLNTNFLAEIDRDRTLRATKLDALYTRAELAWHEDLIRLRHQYQLLELELETLKEQDQGLARQQAVTAIQQEGITAREIAPLDGIRQRMTEESARYARRENERRIARLILQLEELARYPLPDETLISPAPPECLMPTKH